MKEIKNDIIKKYKYKDYVIYIKETNISYEYYLQNEKYGIVELMFGIDKNSKYVDTILDTFNIDDYIITYQNEYED